MSEPKRLWVKICGTTSVADALLAIEHGADALGFIFAPSKRRVSPAQAKAIAAHLPSGVERVGVFTSADVARIAAIVTSVGLTAVQLHLPHDPALTAKLNRRLGPEVRLLQVIGIRADDALNPTLASDPSAGQNAARLSAAFADPSLWAILLDSEKDGRSGGLGAAFSWNAIQPVLRQVLAEIPAPTPAEELPSSTRQPPRLLLAGGLHAGNVNEAIHALGPWGVDCVSGVEAEPGHKDPVRLAAFLKAAHRQASIRA